MSVPSQFGPPPQQSTGSGRTILLILLSVGLFMTVCCGGVCGGLFFFAARIQEAVEQTQASIQEQAAQQASQQALSRGAQDWWINEQLSRAYVTALDAVAQNKEVIDRLGEPIEPQNEPDNLFRRERTGDLTSEDEIIEFDISGPKGKAAVRVITTGAIAPPGGRTLSLAKKITVKFSDSAEIKVPSPNVPDQPEP